MSDDFIETIWAQFAVETEEHIEGIESLLVKADATELSADEISTLFRAFHSLKGLSRVMELGALESVTHRAEDLLGLVRDGTTELNKAAVDLLLRSLDSIKALRDLAVAERTDGEKPAALVKELEQAFKSAASGSPVTAAAAVPESAASGVTETTESSAEATTAASSAPTASTSTATSAASSKVPVPTQPAAPSKLGDSKASGQEVFLRLVRNGVPILEQLASSIAAKAPTAQILAVANDIRGPLGWMVKASTKLGYAGITQRINNIIDSLPSSETFSLESAEKLVDHVVSFLSDLTALGETTGSDLGGESLAKLLSLTLRENLEDLLADIVGNLDVLESRADLSDEDMADAISQQFSRVNSYLTSLYPDMHLDLPLLFVDAYARAARRQLAIYSEVIQLTRDSIAFIKELAGSSHKTPLTQPAFKSQYQRLGQRMKEYLWGNDKTGETPADAVRNFVAKLEIPPELAELLSPDNARELMELIQEGANAYLIMAHLESDENIAGAFVVWLQKSGSVITNRSVFVDETSWYEMLFISKADRQTIETELKAIDPAQKLIQFKAQLGQNIASTAKPAAAAGGAAAAAPKAKAEAKPGAPGKAAAAPPSTNVIRVPGEMLDQFMNQIGEMVLVRGQLAHVIADQRLRDMAMTLRRDTDSTNLDSAQTSLLQKLLELIDEQGRRLQETDALIQGALSRLQDSVMGLRVVPVEMVFKRFPRMVRDLAQAQGKQIRLELLGQEVKIDKAMVESLADPLLHMVRNSADHGVELPAERKAAGKPEEAVIRIQAEQQGSRILIKVSDDGKGMDPERIRRKAVERGLIKEEESHQLSKEDVLKFIFRAGFSTADVVTETSGRGVGMDVVRTNVMRLGGQIHLDSEVGRGSTFTMQMPLSAAVQEVLLVNTAGQTLAIPGRYVAELIEINDFDVQTVKGRTAILLRGNFLPIVRLDELLGFTAQADDDHRFVVVLSDGQRTLGVSVSEFVGRQELFTKDIHPRLSALPGVGGASILGDGRVVLILDGAAIYRLAENVQVQGQMRLPTGSSKKPALEAEPVSAETSDVSA